MNDLPLDIPARFAIELASGNPFVVGVADAMLPMTISDPNLPDNPIVYANPAFETLTGFPIADVVGRNCRFLQGPDTAAADIARLRDAIAARTRISVDLLNYRRDGSAFWNRLLVTPVFGPAGELRYFFASQLDVTLERDRLVQLEAEQRGLIGENERFRREVLETKARLDLALRAGQLGTWTVDPETLALEASAGCKIVFGFDPAEPFTYQDFLATVHPNDRPAVEAAVGGTLNHGAPYECDHRIVTRTGERRWVGARGALVTRRDGSPLTMTGFVSDITARKELEEHRALLADELTHRVKNTLATVGAVVNQSLRTATSLAEARDSIGNRIANLANAHNLLVRGETEGANIGDVVRNAVGVFDDGKAGLFQVDGPDIHLQPGVTLALSMCLHELGTNAAKYGALSVPGGHVQIRWQVRPHDGARAFEFLWKEVGGPPVSPPTRVGFGSRMIDRMMSKHMRGVARTTYPPEGVQFFLQTTL